MAAPLPVSTSRSSSYGRAEGSKTDWGGKGSQLLGYLEQIDTTDRAIEASSKIQYHKETDADHRMPTAYLVLPGDLKLPLEISSGSLADFDQVREETKVRIVGERQNTVLRISGEKPGHVRNAIGAINGVIQGLRTKEGSGRQTFFVQPPRDGNVEGAVVLDFDGTADSGGPRPTLVASDCGPPDQAAASEIMESYKRDICNALETSVISHHAERCQMQMSINFGRLKLRQRQRGRVEYTFQQFVDMVNQFAGRATAGLDCCLGDEQLASGLLSRMVLRPGILPSPIPLRDAIEKYTYSSLCFIGRSVRAEVDIFGTGADSAGSVYLSPPRAYRRDWKRLEITSAALDKKYDWSMEILAKEPATELPTWANGLNTKVSASQQPYTSGFPPGPALRIASDPELCAGVEKICIKTSVKLPYLDTPYMVEISVSKVWGGTDVSKQPATTCAVCMHGPHWNEYMGHLAEVSQTRSWGLDLGILFPGDDDLGTKLASFITQVLSVQDVLSSG